MPCKNKNTHSTHSSAGAVDLSVVLCVKVVNLNTAAPVVLDDLVFGVESTATPDDSHGTSGILFNRDGVLADILEPGVLNGTAAAETVDALSLVCANNDVPDGSTRLENEDCVALTCEN